MIDRDSPAGAWRAELDQGGSCAVCRQRVCGHSDLEYAGIVTLARLASPLPEAGAVHAAENGRG